MSCLRVTRATFPGEFRYQETEGRVRNQERTLSGAAWLHLTSLVSHSNVTMLLTACVCWNRRGSQQCPMCGEKAQPQRGHVWSEVTQLGCGGWEHSPQLSLLYPSPDSQRSRDRTLNAVSDSSHSTLKRHCSAMTLRVSPDTMLSDKASSHSIHSSSLRLVSTGFSGGSASMLYYKEARR